MWPDEEIGEKFPKPKTVAGNLPGMWYRETKFDGYRSLLVCEAESRPPYILSSHRGKATGSLPVLMTVNSKVELPARTVLDGELWWPGHHATDIKHALATDTSPLIFTPWAVLWYAGQELTLETLEINRHRLLNQLPIPQDGFIRLDHAMYQCMNLEKDLAEARALGTEGWVYKDPQGSWGKGWWKAKVSETVDCAVIGIARGNVGVTGQFQDLVGSLVLGLKDISGRWVEVGCTSGMTLQERKDFSKQFASELNQCNSPGDRWCHLPLFPIYSEAVEVRFDEVASQGRLKMPRFVRTRDDKKAEDCLLSQLPPARGAKLPKEVTDAFSEVDRIRTERREAAAQRGAETREASGQESRRESIDS